MKKSLKSQLNASDMLYLREHEGLSNKQIAQRLDVSVSTVYQWIGRKSQAVKHAAVQGKPCPVPNPLNIVAEAATEEEPNEPLVVMKAEALEEPLVALIEEQEEEVLKTSAAENVSQYQPAMPVLKERRIVEFQGDYCVFEVDTGDKSVVMKDGTESALVTGMLDKDSLGLFIRELMQVYNMLTRSR